MVFYLRFSSIIYLFYVYVRKTWYPWKNRENDMRNFVMILLNNLTNEKLK